MKKLYLVLSIIISNSVIFCVPQQQKNEVYDRVPIIPPPRRQTGTVNNINEINSIEKGWSQGLMQSAKTFVASPAGQLAMSMAKEFVARSYGGNQVLSLNLPSLLILVLLKALIFTTGLFGAGNYHQYGRGRLLEEG